MKKIIIDIASVKSVVEVQNRFFGPFRNENTDVLPFKYGSWDAFWDYFGFDLPTDESGEEPVHLILKNASALKRISEEDYEILILQMNRASNQDVVPGTRFTYELIEDSSINSNKQK